jgi:hypothetical protein
MSGDVLLAIVLTGIVAQASFIWWMRWRADRHIRDAERQERKRRAALIEKWTDDDE